MKAGKTILALVMGAALALPAAAWQNPPKHRDGKRGANVPRLGVGTPRSEPGRGRKDRQTFRRPGNRGPGRHGGDWLRKMHNLPADQQERALQNDPEFQRLSPEAQARLRERLRQFNKLSPEQRERMLNRWEQFEHLTPEQQQQARRLHQRMRELPEARRRMMYRALQHLRDMPAGERQRVLASDRFRNMFSDEERNLLRGMAEMGPPPDAPPGAPPEDGPPPSDMPK